MSWFKQELKQEPKQESKRVYRFEDFIEQKLEPEPPDASRLDVLEREVQALRQQVSELASLKSVVASTEKEIEDWLQRRIAQLSQEAAKGLDNARLASALEETGIQRVVAEAVHAEFESEETRHFVRQMAEAIYAAVLKKLGRA